MLGARQGSASRHQVMLGTSLLFIMSQCQSAEGSIICPRTATFVTHPPTELN